MEWMSTPEGWMGLLTLTLLEIVLGVDNVIFISILAGKLPENQRDKARNVGLILAMGMRILLLFSISWVISLKDELFSLFGKGFSGRDLILLGGGLFLIYKATKEIHHKLEGEAEDAGTGKAVTFGNVIFQILLLDVVFSLDSVITAVGMVDELSIMIIAVVLSVGFMLFSAKAVSEFVQSHPTVKMLALSFLLLIGFTLSVEAFHIEIPKGYIYSALGFSILVEFLNLRLKKNKKPPVQLTQRYRVEDLKKEN